MKVAWKQILLGVLIGAVAVSSSQSLDFSGLSGLNFSSSSFTGPSVKDIALNGTGYRGEVVTVSGQVDVTAPPELTFKGLEREISGSAGYSVGIKCRDFIDSFKRTRSYTVTGKVKKTVYGKSLTNELVTYYYIDCTKPPS